MLLPKGAQAQPLQAQPGVPLAYPPSGKQIRVIPPTGKEMVMAIATPTPLDVSQFETSAIDAKLGARQLSGRGTRSLAARIRTLVLEAAPEGAPNSAGSSGGAAPAVESGWGSIFTVFPVANKQ